MGYEKYRGKANTDKLCQWFDVMFCAVLKHPEDQAYKTAVLWISEALTTAELITAKQRDAIMEVIEEKGCNEKKQQG